jgi:hypothetical protein
VEDNVGIDFMMKTIFVIQFVQIHMAKSRDDTNSYMLLPMHRGPRFHSSQWTFQMMMESLQTGIILFTVSDAGTLNVSWRHPHDDKSPIC